MLSSAAPIRSFLRRFCFARESQLPGNSRLLAHARSLKLSLAIRSPSATGGLATERAALVPESVVAPDIVARRVYLLARANIEAARVRVIGIALES